MGLETTLFSIFGGNAASGEISKMARKTKRFVTDNFADQKTAIAPFREAGTEGVNFLRDLLSGGPDNIGASGEAILGDIGKRVTGRFAGMGLTDSGAHTNALADALLRARLGIRGQMFGEGATLAGIGQNSISQLLNAGGMANQGVANANATIGEAKAFPWLNASNALYRWEDQILNAAGKAAGGGFG